MLAAMEVRVMPQEFLAFPRSPFLGKVRIKPFVHLSIVFCVIYIVAVLKQ